jgi:RND family efflux transporter MFP subunit
MTEEREHVRNHLEALRIDRGDDPRRRRRPRWRWRMAFLALAIVAGLLFFRARTGRPVPVTVVEATRVQAGEQTALPVLSGSGYVVTGDRYISVGVRVPGRIERYFVEEGQSVQADDPLVQLDDRDYRAAVERTEAALAVARANLELADAELARGMHLRRGRVISQQELDVLINRAAVARATVKQTEAELRQARVSLEYTTLRAPSDGVILAKLKEVGEIAVPGGFAGSGDLIRLANLTDMRAEVDVNEADLNRVSPEQPAEVVPDAYPDRRYAATVVKLYPQVDRQKGTLKVEVHIAQPDDKLLPDMSVRVTFLQQLPAEEARMAAVLIPAAALQRNGTDAPHVWVVDNGVARQVPVESGGVIGDRARITGGLDGGERVVVTSEAPLRDGMAVSATSH